MSRVDAARHAVRVLSETRARLAGETVVRRALPTTSIPVRNSKRRSVTFNEPATCVGDEAHDPVRVSPAPWVMCRRCGAWWTPPKAEAAP